MTGIVKIWRGTRSEYEAVNPKDFYTRYSVREENGAYTEYYGTHEITSRTGQVPPVIDIIDSLSAVSSVFYSGLSYEPVNLGDVVAIGVKGLSGTSDAFNITKYENGQPMNEYVFNSHPLRVQYYSSGLLTGYYVHWWASDDDQYTPHMEESPEMTARRDEIVSYLNKYYKDIDRLNLGDRYLDSTTFDVIEKTYYGLTRKPLGNDTVVVVGKEMAEYRVLDGELMTYETKIINCGTY